MKTRKASIDAKKRKIGLRGKEIVLKPEVRAKIKALGLTEKDIDEAIRWARGR